MKNIFISVMIGLIILFVIWYFVSPLFIDKVVNETIPSDNDVLNEIEQESFIGRQGSFVSADSFHQVKGSAKIINIDGKNYLSLENFESTNGPDLKVYLSEDLNADSYVSLGELKGNIGDQNYELGDIDLERYDNVLIWCERFSVLFGNSELSS